MKKSKIKPVLLLTAISFIIIAANFAGNKNPRVISDCNNNSNTYNYPADSADHDPIFIDGNSELATFISNEGLNGEGTYASPYIIEDFSINAATMHGIEIINTDAYLTIQNCVIEGLVGYSYRGILLNNSENVNINDNTLIDNWSGISLWGSSNNVLCRNYLNISQHGIELVKGSNNNIISDNDANNHAWGITLEDSLNNILSGNNFSHNSNNGIVLTNSNNNTLSGNDIHYNGDVGISMNSICLNNTLSMNNVSYNYNFGIFLWNDCINNTIYFNDIYENEDFSDACDISSEGNQWDNGTTGNYWGNAYNITYPDANNDGFIWDTPFEIEGGGDSIDNFPLVNSIAIKIPFETESETETEFKISGFPFKYLIIFIFVGVFKLSRKIIHRNLT